MSVVAFTKKAKFVKIIKHIIFKIKLIFLFVQIRFKNIEN